jgi:hypothetical protein
LDDKTERRKESMKLVAIFADENSEEDLDTLFKDLEETSCEKIFSFDDGNKVVMEVPSEIPDPDWEYSLEDYWMGVMNDSSRPCCYPSEELSISMEVYKVKTLDKFWEDSVKLNNGKSPYESVFKEHLIVW